MAGNDISGGSERSGNGRKANQRGAARLAAVQALYQMELAGTGLNEILAQFESHWLKGDMEGVQYRPAEAAYFRDIVGGVVREQSDLDRKIDAALTRGWPLKRIEMVLRAVLRAGAYELACRKDVPARVVTSEYVDVASAFVDQEETGMVNAVLDQLAHQLRAAEFGAGSRRQQMPSDQGNSKDGLSGQERLIARYFRPLATAPNALDLGDDAALLTPPAGCDLVLTTDGVIAGVHFLAPDPPQSIARKALRMNLSDLAAKGATPVGFLLSIALPANTEESWIAAFAEGLGQDISHYGCPLLGGDTDRAPGPLSIAITALGALPHGAMVRRATAKPDDVIAITGTIGDAALGVLIHRDADLAQQWRLSGAASEHLRQRYLLPQPRNALAGALRKHASAAMDVSDGLAGDLAKLCRASGLAAEVDVDAVPMSDAARAALSADAKLIERIMTGGDDYEIVLTLPSAQFGAFRTDAESAGVPLSKIGQVTRGQGVRFLHEGKVLSFAQPSYSHF